MKLRYTEDQKVGKVTYNDRNTKTISYNTNNNYNASRSTKLINQINNFDNSDSYRLTRLNSFDINENNNIFNNNERNINNESNADSTSNAVKTGNTGIGSKLLKQSQSNLIKRSKSKFAFLDENSLDKIEKIDNNKYTDFNDSTYEEKNIKSESGSPQIKLLKDYLSKSKITENIKHHNIKSSSISNLLKPFNSNNESVNLVYIPTTNNANKSNNANITNNTNNNIIINENKKFYDCDSKSSKRTRNISNLPTSTSNISRQFKDNVNNTINNVNDTCHITKLKDRKYVKSNTGIGTDKIKDGYTKIIIPNSLKLQNDRNNIESEEGCNDFGRKVSNKIKGKINGKINVVNNVVGISERCLTENFKDDNLDQKKGLGGLKTWEKCLILLNLLYSF